MAGLGDDDADLPIVQAVIALAHGLGIDVTAEGIETAEQLACLRDLACDRGQGFYYARPLPATQVVKLLEPDAPPPRRVIEVPIRGAARDGTQASAPPERRSAQGELGFAAATGWQGLLAAGCLAAAGRSTARGRRSGGRRSTRADLGRPNGNRRAGGSR